LAIAGLFVPQEGLFMTNALVAGPVFGYAFAA
jgi:hypothetical protein